MTTLEKIVKKAQALKKSYPNKFVKWTDYVKEASKEFRSTTTPAKKKSKLAGVKKKAPKKVVSKKLTSKKASDLIRAEVKSKQFIMPHGYEVRKSKLAGNSEKYLLKLADDYAYATSGNLDRAIYNLLDPQYTKTLIPKYKKAIKEWEIKNKTKISGNKLTGIKKKEFNPKSLIGKEVFKSVGAKDVYTITEVEQISANNIKITLEKNTFSIQASFTLQNLIDLSKGKIVKNLKLLDKISGSKITPAEHYLSYAPPSKPSEQAIYKGIERVKQDILRLQGMQKDHMFKKHKASLNGAINTKNREIKELLNKLK